MNLKLDKTSRPSTTCPSCKKVCRFERLVDHVIESLQPTTTRDDQTGLLVCSECKTVIFLGE